MSTSVNYEYCENLFYVTDLKHTIIVEHCRAVIVLQKCCNLFSCVKIMYSGDRVRISRYL